MIVPLVVIRCHSLSLDVSLVCLFINDREKLAISKLFFSKFKKFVSSSVFGELQLTQISSNSKTSFCNLKIRGLAAKLYLVFLLFQFRKQLWCFKINKLIFADLSKKSKSFKTIYSYPSKRPPHALSDDSMFYRGFSNSSQDMRNEIQKRADPTEI